MLLEITMLQGQLACKRSVLRYLSQLLNKEMRRNKPDRLLINRLRDEHNVYLAWIDRINRRLRVLA